MTGAILVGAIVFAVSLSTSASAAEVELPIDLPLPAKIEQVVRKTRLQERNGQAQTVIIDSRSIASVALNARSDGYRVNLKVLELTSSSPEVQALLASTQPEAVEYEADASLSPEALLDWEALRAQQIAAANKISATTGATVQRLFSQMTAASAAPLLLKEQTMLAIGQNLILQPVEPTTYEGEAPLPTGGAPVKVKGSVRLEKLDEKGKVAMVRWAETIDSASALAATQQLAGQLAALAPQDSKTLAEIMKSMTLDFTKGCLFEIDLQSGLARKAECEDSVAVSAGGQSVKRSDRWTITQTLIP